ncbi:MAG: sugar phosphate isomerase/epimerase [Spirochaetales bacterium]|nr:MAG: sugar phosphate isomerase/epimerase [Spirochaetales bacterium]
MEFNVDAHLWCLGTFGERYVPNGYFDPMPLEEQLSIMSKTPGFDGLMVFYPPTPGLPEDPEKLKKKLADYNLKLSSVVVENWSDRKWKHGAFCTTEKAVREENIALFKRAIDYCKACGGESVLLWPAHDGFDYPFQVNYKDGWKRLVESIRTIGEYDKSVRIAVEYKAKDPRQKQYVNTVGKCLALLNDINLPNVLGVVDVGHSLQAQENVAEAITLLDSHGKLGQIHLNENYKDSDPDMIFGTINFFELLEFFYYLNKTDYKGWCSIDIIAGRDDRKKSFELAVKMVRKYKAMADRLTEHKDEIDKNLAGYHFADNMNLISDLIFK